MKLRIISVLAALLLLSGMAGGCSSSGGSSSLNAVLKILPDGVSNIFVADWSKLRADNNLKELWTSYTEKLSLASMEEFLGLNSDEVESMTIAADGSTEYIVLKGKFDKEKIRTTLES
jgi:hypothetical protein